MFVTAKALSWLSLNVLSMKYFLLSSLIIFNLLACKSSKKVEEIKPIQNEDALPWGVLSFSLADVPFENIRFVNKYQGNSSSHVIVVLPENYPHGDLLKLNIKIPPGYRLRSDSKDSLNSENFSTPFNGQKLRYLVTDYTGLDSYKPYGEILIEVTPSVPIVSPSSGESFKITLDGEPKVIFLPAVNWGTDETLNEKDSLIINGYTHFKNKRSGIVTTSSSDFKVPNEKNWLNARLPETMEAGEYEMTLQRDQRKVTLKDAVVLTYGDPIIRPRDFYSISAFTDSSFKVSYSGFNLFTGHTYELQISNEFSSVIKVNLKPQSRFELEGFLPKDVARGAYKAALYIDQKAVSYHNFITETNLVYAKKQLNEPAIGLLSQQSERYDSYSDFASYTPIKNFRRDQEILAYLDVLAPFKGATPSQVILLLKNLQSGLDYELPQTSLYNHLGVTIYPLFKILESVPAGTYSVRCSIQYTGDPKIYVSGNYYKTIYLP